MRYGEHVTEANTVGKDLLAAPAQREGIDGLLARTENWKLDAGAPFASAFYHLDSLKVGVIFEPDELDT